MASLEDLDDGGIPVLEGWLSLPAVGDLLGVTRQRIYQMGLNERKFATIRKIPGKAPDDPGKRARPAVYVVKTEEAERFLAEQRAAIARHDSAGNPLNEAGLVVDPGTGRVPGQGTQGSYALTPAGAAAAQ
jgi:hypothetical protein